MPGPKRAAKIEAKRKRLAGEADTTDTAQAPNEEHARLLQPGTPVVHPEKRAENENGADFDEEYNRVDSDDDLENLSKRELENLARDRSLSREGTKKDIIKRLRGED